MAEATSSCAKAWGQCMRDARCEDKHCPGHPTIGCRTCKGGPCPTPQACQLPMLELQPIRRRLFARRRFLPDTREAWGRAIGALLGFGGFVLFAGEWLRRFFT